MTSKRRDDDARARGPRQGDACVRTPYIDPADVIYVVLSLEYERVCVVCGLSYTGRTDGPYTRTHTPIYVRYQTDILDDARARMHARMHA